MGYRFRVGAFFKTQCITTISVSRTLDGAAESQFLN